MSKNDVRNRKTNISDKARTAEKNNETKTNNTKKSESRPTYGLPKQRVFTRLVLVICVVVVVYFTSNKNKESILAKQNLEYERRAHDVPCSETYRAELNKFKGCVPEKCGRVVSDKLITKSEVDSLLNLVTKVMSLGGSDGSASILDLHSGALSHGNGFVDFYKLPDAVGLVDQADFITYKVVRAKIQHAISHHFGVDVQSLHLTHPTFFSRLTNIPPKTIHDEYWHRHVDKETYESFHYTSLVYLNDFNSDFKGGRFMFYNVDNSTTVVEPRKSRTLMFTSGDENPHSVERVASGTRYAVTVSFTCDETKAIQDPRLHWKT